VGKGEAMRRRIEDVCSSAELGESRVVVAMPPTPTEGDADMSG
jgi:hypothetical protein